MAEKLFLINREFLEEVPPENLCIIDLSSGDYSGYTAEEVGGICKAGLQKILDYTDKIGVTLLCSAKYDVFYFARGSRLSKHISMDPRHIEATEVSLHMVAELPYHNNLDLLINLLREELEDRMRILHDREHYLELIRAKITEAKDLGVTLTIDEIAQTVTYQVRQRKPIVCNIDKEGYYRILRALNNLRTTRAKRANPRT